MKPTEIKHFGLVFEPNGDGMFSVDNFHESAGHFIQPFGISAEDAQKILAGDVNALRRHIKKVSDAESGTYRVVGGASLLAGGKYEPTASVAAPQGVFRELQGFPDAIN